MTRLLMSGTCTLGLFVAASSFPSMFSGNVDSPAFSVCAAKMSKNRKKYNEMSPHERLKLIKKLVKENKKMKQERAKKKLPKIVELPEIFEEENEIEPEKLEPLWRIQNLENEKEKLVEENEKSNKLLQTFRKLYKKKEKNSEFYVNKTNEGIKEKKKMEQQLAEKDVKIENLENDIKNLEKQKCFIVIWGIGTILLLYAVFVLLVSGNIVKF